MKNNKQRFYFYYTVILSSHLLMFNNNHPQWRGTCALERSGENREDERKHNNNSGKKNYVDAGKTVFKNYFTNNFSLYEIYT